LNKLHKKEHRTYYTLLDWMRDRWQNHYACICTN